VVLKSNDFSEAPEILSGGVLPLRRFTDHRDFSMADPALDAMTDFTRSVPISVAPERPIDEALADMMRFGVRALLVISGDSIVGLITTHDILGPRPLAFASRSDPARENIRVGDIMTGWDAMPTVAWATMQSARIRDLLEIFDGTGATHLLVVEGGDRGVPVVRGLVSRGRIDRRLEE
jgi:CBS domain-containing protein